MKKSVEVFDGMLWIFNHRNTEYRVTFKMYEPAAIGVQVICRMRVGNVCLPEADG